MSPEEQTPIALKAKEIQQMVFSLIDLVKESELPQANENELALIEDDLWNMKALSTEIYSHVVSCSRSYLPYDLKMENAVMIRRAARGLQTYAINIEDMGLKDIDYLDLIHEELEAFRLLFIEWIKTFELWKYDEEDWGLFSPEGIQLLDTGHHDEDFDDDDEFEEDFDDDDDEFDDEFDDD